MTIREVGISELSNVFELMKQLRPKLSPESFKEIYVNARNESEYAIVGAFLQSNCVGLIGYRVLTDFVHGKHVYVDDLVVDRDRRSEGIGAKLLKFAEEVAAKNNCTGLRLCTGVENSDGKRFYEREGWSLRAVVYKKKC